MLNHIPYLVLFAMICLACNLYGLRPEGVLRRQFAQLSDIKNVRSFGDNDGDKSPTGPFLLILQWCICCGLVIYMLLDEDAAESLATANPVVWSDVGICIAAPAIWLVVQWLLYHWCASLFHEGDRAHILTRVYNAVHILSSPLALLVLLCEVSGLLSATSSGILLLLIFIIAQIVFILSGIRIFWSGIGTIFLIILYLCAFKIAPLLLLSANLG